MGVLVKKTVFGVGITDATEEEVLEYILKGLKNPSDSYYIVTPNPEMVVYATKHAPFRTILNNARLALCDGIGVLLASRILGQPIRERIAGVDLLENLCREVAKQPITVGFLGGGPKIAEKTAECLRKKYPGLKVVFAGAEWSARGPIDILFVAFGFPKQEEWMAAQVGNAPVRVMIGVGGAFDYLSGRVQRAPEWIRTLGLEWVFRLVVEPWRIKRQVALITFVWLILKERLADL